jgi:hypothetical protein
MSDSFHLESFSPAMKARLDPRYRRILKEERHPEIEELRKSISRSKDETALPFTTRTRAYGTYTGGK